jgi:tetratricopeptide (TPR) repeat protein
VKILNKVNLEFTEWEIPFLIPEMIKSLKDKNYSIERNQLNPSSDFKLVDISIPKTPNQALQPMQFTSGDSLPNSLLEGTTEYISKADALYKNNKYFEASEAYSKILNSITSFQDATEKKLKPLIANIETRILLSTTANTIHILQTKDEAVPKNLQSISDEVLLSYFQSYLDEWKKYRAVPNFAKSEKIETVFRTRTEGLLKVYLTRIESSGDEFYQTLQFEKALFRYKSIEPIWKTHSQFLDLKDYQEQISLKIDTTMKSGTAYVSGVTRGYLQFAKSENSRSILEGSMENNPAQVEKKEKAIQFMSQAFNLIKTYPKFLENDLVSNYNSLAKEINVAKS